MACLPHDRKHQQENQTMPIYKGDDAGRLLTCHEARMLHGEAEVQRRTPAVPSVHENFVGTTKESG
jgi:hypothetical protein